MSDEMREVILNQHEQITHSLEVNKDVKIDLPALPAGQAGGRQAADCDSIILAGMGGSGHPGDLLNALGITTKPLYVHRNYDLPLEYLANMGLTSPLFIASSFSGNTEESLTGYEQAKKENIPILASASGGKLEKLAGKNNTPFCHIDYADMQPRHALFAAFTGIYTALKNSGLAKDIDEELTRVAEVIKNVAPELEAPAKTLAAQIKDKIPVYYASDNLGFAAKNMKIQTNENAKYPGFWNVIPESNHNELIGFSKLKELNNPNKFFVLMLRDPDDHPRNAARIEATTNQYRDWGAEVEHFEVKGSSPLEKTFYAVTFGLWLAKSLAEVCGIDPIPVDGVEGFKAQLVEIAGEA